jgi:hypothetical protein
VAARQVNGETAVTTDTVENLILDLVEWVGRKERTYRETMEAWRTSCPRLPVWEDATERGFVETTFSNGQSLVEVTQTGLDFLKERRPECYEQLRHRTTELRPDNNSELPLSVP